MHNFLIRKFVSSIQLHLGPDARCWAGLERLNVSYNQIQQVLMVTFLVKSTFGSRSLPGVWDGGEVDWVVGFLLGKNRQVMCLAHYESSTDTEMLTI